MTSALIPRQPCGPDAVREHYEWLAQPYLRLWGEHLHHGLWKDGESDREAPVRLVEHVAAAADIPRGAHVLDVGCGYGGSAIWLARERDCTVLGLTISPAQAELAGRRARDAGLQDRVSFVVRDASRLRLPARSFDAVWVIECSEHIRDKARFVADVADVLRCGGRLALCTWLAQPVSPAQRRLVSSVCRGMLCPALASPAELAGWLRDAGLRNVRLQDLTAGVRRTWTRVSEILGRPEVRTLLRMSAPPVRDFARAAVAIGRAYDEGAMGYGLFTAHKPPSARGL
jgi:tocopherol O-methyltransferase